MALSLCFCFYWPSAFFFLFCFSPVFVIKKQTKTYKKQDGKIFFLAQSIFIIRGFVISFSSVPFYQETCESKEKYTKSINHNCRQLENTNNSTDNTKKAIGLQIRFGFVSFSLRRLFFLSRKIFWQPPKKETASSHENVFNHQINTWTTVAHIVSQNERIISIS